MKSVKTFAASTVDRVHLAATGSMKGAGFGGDLGCRRVGHGSGFVGERVSVGSQWYVGRYGQGVRNDL